MNKLSRMFTIISLTFLFVSCLPTTAPVINTEYILSTDFREGEFVYIGVSEEISGVINPALHAEPGEQIRVILINAGFGTHDFAIPELNLSSDKLDQQGETTTFSFSVPDHDAVLRYVDSEHEELGMSGVILVGDITAQSSPPADAVPVSNENPSETTGQVVAYTLESALTEGRMVYIGIGGEIDGLVNPDLIANPGDTVQITLFSGEGAAHNFLVDEFGARSDEVVGQGNSVSLEFTPDRDGTFAYYCDLPGHRQAGMEGRLIVGTGNASVGASESAGSYTSASSGTSSAAAAGPVDPDATDIVRDPTDLPGPIGSRGPQTTRIDLVTVEISGQLADGTTFTYWTFNGLVPGPFIRVRVGDTIEVHLSNLPDSTMSHSVDFHAVTGPGGGAVATQTQPGGETMFTFQALNPGLYVYHCATPMVAQHIANGMYGLILVEPEGGLPPVDREFYVMQGELYTAQPFGTLGMLTEDTTKLLNETPEYFVFNGASMALTSEAHALNANVGETVRIYFGVGGPNFTSAFHVIGEIFDRVYDQASITAPPLTDVQTTLVPPGGATVVEFSLEVPGRFILVDHALSRLQRGLAGFLFVSGDPNPEVFNTETSTED